VAFVHYPHKSTRHAAGQLNMPHTTMQKILQKCLKFKSYKYQLLQNVTAQDKEVHYTFCCDYFQELKMNFLQPKLSSVMKLVGRIRDAVATVTLNLLTNVWTEIEYRYDICQAHTH
jgi:hypothetical protein